MALRNIRLSTDELLRKKSKPVKVIDEKIKILLDDMLETMYANNGVGLAAPQVGVLKRVVVIDIGDENIIELINPVFVLKEGEQINSEGCLSVPGASGYVNRPNHVRVQALDRNGVAFELEAEGFMAIALCHEIDHLDGILYIDKVIEGYEEEEELEEIPMGEELQ